MDIGHRVYATEDPRATYPRVTSAEHAGTRGDDTCYGMSRRIGEVVAMTRHARTGGEAGLTGNSAAVGGIAYVAVLVCTVAGVYIAWRQGSDGGGWGGVVAGSALLMAAVVRLILPGKLAGLLASRRRLTDVLTLTVFGAGLLAAGLVLPRLGPPSAQGRAAGPPTKGKHE